MSEWREQKMNSNKQKCISDFGAVIWFLPSTVVAVYVCVYRSKENAKKNSINFFYFFFSLCVVRFTGGFLRTFRQFD